MTNPRDDYDRRLDEWVPPDRIDFTTYKRNLEGGNDASGDKSGKAAVKQERKMTRNMKRKIAGGHIRSITSSNKENVGVANFGKRVWKLRPSTLIFHMNKKEEPTKTEKSEKSRSPFMVICVVEYVQQLIEIVQEMFNMYFDEIWYRCDRRPCLVSLASNFTQAMNELVDDCSVGLLLGAISVQVATRTCPVIFGGISIGLIMTHFHFRKPRYTEANQRATEASWQAHARSPQNDIHGPPRSCKCSRTRYD